MWTSVPDAAKAVGVVCDALGGRDWFKAIDGTVEKPVRDASREGRRAGGRLGIRIHGNQLARRQKDVLNAYG
jgi:hypothetical protein